MASDPTSMTRDLRPVTSYTRRRVLELLGVGAAGVPLLMLPGRSSARSPAADHDGGRASETGEEAANVGVFAPHRVGSVLLGAEIVRIGVASQGVVTVQLRKPSGDLFRVEMYARDDKGPAPVAATRHYALFLANGGRGDKRTDEGEGLTLYALAAAVRNNESRIDLLPVIAMRARWERDAAGL